MKYTDIQKMGDNELNELVDTTRETLRAERFKDKFSKKASIIRTAKATIARILTEKVARQRKVEVK